ncbi:SMI1/KNR4 family protein [Chitinophaga sp. LS1]|uniref:SMI1/KNR4 family protein n=1 Tax=Chitinophaga sp. LS1 TaxID=3051176 RepID=UPI002AABB091|nr:SMI1/KNR4 family protein [Chitinophaga sp. LS1]WPV65824.1 hypothetical protein QQL36_28900 [Chitinophaga sp. LS1]
MELSRLLLLFERDLAQFKYPYLDILQIGLSPDVVTKRLSTLHISSDLLVILYGWRNGVLDMDNRVIGQMELFARAIMLPLENAIEHYDYAITNDMWKEKLFPIFTSGGGDFLLFDANEQNQTVGQILTYSPSVTLSEEPVSIYDDMNTMFETVIECYRQGAYRFDESGFIEVDYQIEQQLSQSKNPNSEYWKLDN